MESDQQPVEYTLHERKLNPGAGMDKPCIDLNDSESEKLAEET